MVGTAGLLLSCACTSVPQNKVGAKTIQVDVNQEASYDNFFEKEYKAIPLATSDSTLVGESVKYKLLTLPFTYSIRSKIRYLPFLQKGISCKNTATWGKVKENIPICLILRFMTDTYIFFPDLINASTDIHWMTDIWRKLNWATGLRSSG